MVAPGVGHDLHYGFHAKQRSAYAAAARMDLFATGKDVDAGASNVARIPSGAANDCRCNEKRRRAALKTNHVKNDNNHHRDLSAASTSRLKLADELRHM